MVMVLNLQPYLSLNFYLFSVYAHLFSINNNFPLFRIKLASLTFGKILMTFLFSLISWLDYPVSGDDDIFRGTSIN